MSGNANQKVTARFVNVTPAMAAAWRERNHTNRNFRILIAQGYADEMRAGRWRLSGDALQFNREGELINGQHRLWAVVESGVTCQFLVMENLDDETAAITDGGTPRQASDTLKMLYGIERANVITGVIKALDQYIDGRRLKLSIGHAIEQVARYQGGCLWAVQAAPGRSRFAAAPVIAALVFAHRTNPVGVSEFGQLLFTGANLTDTSPILKCRNYIIDQGGAGRTKAARLQTFLLVLTALDRYLTHAGPVKHLKANPLVLNKFTAAYATA